jgi:hypothetical protein
VLEYTIKMKWKKNVIWAVIIDYFFLKKNISSHGVVKTEEENTLFFSEKLLYPSPKKNPSFLAALTSLWERKGVDKWKNPCDRAPVSSSTLAFRQTWQIK